MEGLEAGLKVETGLDGKEWGRHSGLLRWTVGAARSARKTKHSMDTRYKAENSDKYRNLRYVPSAGDYALEQNNCSTSEYNSLIKQSTISSTRKFLT